VLYFRPTLKRARRAAREGSRRADPSTLGWRRDARRDADHDRPADVAPIPDAG
jgi:hypothetical protein